MPSAPLHFDQRSAWKPPAGAEQYTGGDMRRWPTREKHMGRWLYIHRRAIRKDERGWVRCHCSTAARQHGRGPGRELAGAGRFCRGWRFDARRNQALAGIRAPWRLYLPD